LRGFIPYVTLEFIPTCWFNKNLLLLLFIAFILKYKKQKRKKNERLFESTREFKKKRNVFFQNNTKLNFSSERLNNRKKTELFK